MTLNENIAKAIIQALGTGTGFPWIGDDEGQVDFWTAAGSNYQNTELVSGADGTTTYMKVVATWTAPETTTVTSVFLYGTSGSRETTTRTRLAEKDPLDSSRTLEKGQGYSVFFSINAEI